METNNVLIEDKEMALKNKRFELASEIAKIAHGGNGKIIETADFLAGVMYTQNKQSELFTQIESLLDEEFQTKDELIPASIVEIYELIEKYKL